MENTISTINEILKENSSFFLKKKCHVLIYFVVDSCANDVSYGHNRFHLFVRVLSNDRGFLFAFLDVIHFVTVEGDHWLDFPSVGSFLVEFDARLEKGKKDEINYWSNTFFMETTD